MSGRFRRFWPAILLLTPLSAGCEGPPPEVYATNTGKVSSTSAVPVGTNEAGEPCRYQLASGSVSGVAARREAVLYCGDWEQPSGHVSEIAQGSDPAQLTALASSGPWRSYIDQRFACGAPAPTRLADGAPAALMQCTRRAGGWPHIALTASVGGRIFAVDAVRPAMPAVEATLGALTGRASPAAASGSEARRLIAQRTGGSAFGSGDEGRYFQQIRLGDAYNNIDDPANAERAYREALAIQQKVLGADNPGLALTVMKLAAQIAHQGNPPEAEKLLGRAAQLIAKSGDPLLNAHLDYYRAVALAYQGRTAEALAGAQRAEAAFARLAPDAVTRGQRAQLSRSGPGGAGVLRGGSIESLLSDDTPNTQSCALPSPALPSRCGCARPCCSCPATRCKRRRWRSAPSSCSTPMRCRSPAPRRARSDCSPATRRSPAITPGQPAIVPRRSRSSRVSCRVNGRRR
jgi:hypothetical protein